MPNTLTEKAIAQPFRVGIMLGALTLPALWVASKDAWNWLQGLRWLSSEQVTQVFALGFLPGMILGAGALRALVLWKADEIGRARWLLISHGGLVALFAGTLLVRDLQRTYALAQISPTRAPQILSHSLPIWFHYALKIADAVPLQVAIIMLLLGLFMRSENV